MFFAPVLLWVSSRDTRPTFLVAPSLFGKCARASAERAPPAKAPSSRITFPSAEYRRRETTLASLRLLLCLSDRTTIGREPLAASIAFKEQAASRTVQLVRQKPVYKLTLIDLLQEHRVHTLLEAYSRGVATTLHKADST